MMLGNEPSITQSQFAEIAIASCSDRPAAMVFTGYFERQVLARCGLHALNNAIGYEFLSAPLLHLACQEYIEEMHREGVAEDRAVHERATGWYSEVVLAFGLRMHQNIYRLDLDNPIRCNLENSAERIYNPEVLGVIVNQDQGHWTTFKYLGDCIWFIDSDAAAPVAKSFGQFRNYIEFYLHAFAVVSIA